MMLSYNTTQLIAIDPNENCRYWYSKESNETRFSRLLIRARVRCGLRGLLSNENPFWRSKSLNWVYARIRRCKFSRPIHRTFGLCVFGNTPTPLNLALKDWIPVKDSSISCCNSEIADSGVLPRKNKVMCQFSGPVHFNKLRFNDLLFRQGSVNKIAFPDSMGMPIKRRFFMWIKQFRFKMVFIRKFNLFSDKRYEKRNICD